MRERKKNCIKEIFLDLDYKGQKKRAKRDQKYLRRRREGKQLKWDEHRDVCNKQRKLLDSYRAFHGFGQAKFPDGGNNAQFKSKLTRK